MTNDNLKTLLNMVYGSKTTYSYTDCFEDMYNLLKQVSKENKEETPKSEEKNIISNYNEFYNIIKTPEVVYISFSSIDMKVLMATPNNNVHCKRYVFQNFQASFNKLKKFCNSNSIILTKNGFTTNLMKYSSEYIPIIKNIMRISITLFPLKLIMNINSDYFIGSGTTIIIEDEIPKFFEIWPEIKTDYLNLLAKEKRKTEQKIQDLNKKINNIMNPDVYTLTDEDKLYLEISEGENNNVG